jgi:hypothetical protein
MNGQAEPIESIPNCFIDCLQFFDSLILKVQHSAKLFGEKLQDMKSESLESIKGDLRLLHERRVCSLWH